MDDSPAPFIVFKPSKPELYEVALELVGLVHSVIESADTVRYHLKDRLDRHTSAIAMALANVTDDPPAARWPRYRRALDLATASQILLDIMARQGCPPTVELSRTRETLANLVTALAPLAFRGN
jgi:hypothetical protein